MSGVELLLLLVAGLGGGLAGSIAGLASLFSYPALLAVGLGPVAANVTNTVALVFVSAGSALGSRTELEGQARARPASSRSRPCWAAAPERACCCSPPSDTFERIAPWLIGAASLTILLRPRVRRAGEAEQPHAPGPA